MNDDVDRVIEPGKQLVFTEDWESRYVESGGRVVSKELPLAVGLPVGENAAKPNLFRA